MSQFIFTCNLGKRRTFLPCITYEQYKDVCKIILNNDVAAFDRFWNVIFTDKLNIVEKLIALIEIRELSLGTSLSLIYQKKAVAINLTEIATKLREVLITLENTYSNNDLDASIVFLENFENLENVTPEKYFKVSGSIDDLDLQTYKNLEKNLETLEKQMRQILITPHFPLSLLDTSLWILAKFLFEDNLLNLIELDLSIIKNLKCFLSDVNKMTYQELNLLIKLHNAEIEKEKIKNEQSNPFQPTTSNSKKY